VIDSQRRDDERVVAICSKAKDAEMIVAALNNNVGAVGALERIAAIETETPLLGSSEAARLRNAVAIAVGALHDLRGQ
jgi:hypothetical protein